MLWRGVVAWCCGVVLWRGVKKQKKVSLFIPSIKKQTSII
jgi:hypothetical protein